MAHRSTRWRRIRPPLHWRLAVSARKRWHRIRRVFRPDRPLEQCRYFGAKFSVDPADVLGTEVMLKRYEWLQIPRLIKACQALRPEIFIDVGANAGIYSCIVGCRRLAKRVVAFEPSPSALERLRAHLQLNQLPDTEVYSFALGDKSGRAILSPAKPRNSGTASILSAGGTGIEIAVVRLDDIVSMTGQPLVIKIDVEGYGLSVLRGAERLLSENHGYAQIEVLDEGDESVIAQMAKFGWRVTDRINDDFLFEREVGAPSA